MYIDIYRVKVMQLVTCTVHIAEQIYRAFYTIGRYSRGENEVLVNAKLNKLIFVSPVPSCAYRDRGKLPTWRIHIRFRKIRCACMRVQCSRSVSSQISNVSPRNPVLELLVSHSHVYTQCIMTDDEYELKFCLIKCYYIIVT